MPHDKWYQQQRIERQPKPYPSKCISSWSETGFEPLLFESTYEFRPSYEVYNKEVRIRRAFKVVRFMCVDSLFVRDLRWMKCGVEWVFGCHGELCCECLSILLLMCFYLCIRLCLEILTVSVSVHLDSSESIHISV